MQERGVDGRTLFILMGIILQKTQLAEQLLESMGRLFDSMRGELAVSTIFVGALLAASTGVVGASGCGHGRNITTGHAQVRLQQITGLWRHLHWEPRDRSFHLR